MKSSNQDHWKRWFWRGCARPGCCGGVPACFPWMSPIRIQGSLQQHWHPHFCLNSHNPSKREYGLVFCSPVQRLKMKLDQWGASFTLRTLKTKIARKLSVKSVSETVWMQTFFVILEFLSFAEPFRFHVGNSWCWRQLMPGIWKSAFVFSQRSSKRPPSAS